MRVVFPFPHSGLTEYRVKRVTPVGDVGEINGTVRECHPPPDSAERVLRTKSLHRCRDGKGILTKANPVYVRDDQRM